MTTYKNIAQIMTIALLISAAPAFAESAPAPSDHKPMMHEGKEGGEMKPTRMMRGDANKDGFLTKEEMVTEHQKRIDNMFTNSDTNKDNKLSPEELREGRKAMREKMKERMQEHKENKEQMNDEKSEHESEKEHEHK